mmetsp:Transcript_27434/g.62018  ORF Transcript_27434/g.62018 Transcript_27434/m.62018 type:complete len:121 (-) Transcript_27434:11-373(-)
MRLSLMPRSEYWRWQNKCLMMTVVHDFASVFFSQTVWRHVHLPECCALFAISAGFNFAEHLESHCGQCVATVSSVCWLRLEMLNAVRSSGKSWGKSVAQPAKQYPGDPESQTEKSVWSYW